MTAAIGSGRRPGPPPDGGAALSERLRHYLTERLPPHMVPSTIVVRDALPLTPNRKVDVAALPDPPDSAFAASRQEPAVAPADEREEAVAAIWREVLGRDDLSVHDDFFGVGGNSLAVMRVLGQLRKRYNYRIAVQDFFDQPTIRALAHRVRAGPDA